MRSTAISLAAMTLLAACAGGGTEVSYLELSPAMLYQGLVADNLCQTGDREIVIDPRKLASGEPVRGTLLTDVIDMRDPENGQIVPEAGLERLEVTCWASVPSEGAVALEIRWGDSFYDTTGWSDWRAADGLTGAFYPESASYFQVRLTLEADTPSNSPRVSGLDISAEYGTGKKFGDALKVVEFDNPEIVRSPVAFGYERADQPAVAEFVERNRLRQLVSSCSGELDTLVTVLHWVGATRNTREGRFDSGPYPWDIERIVSYGSDGTPSIEGHCMSYAVVYITALTGLGFHARHWADQGFRFADHEVVEVWSNSLAKWIYMDPSLSHYYRDTRSGEPAGILELHRVFTDTFFRDGENLRMDMDTQRERVAEIGGKNVPLDYVGSGIGYGEPVPDYDWGWLHGYLAAGFMRLTTRNDYHSHPGELFPYFGEGVHDFDTFLSWSDPKTPVAEALTRFSDRERDFYWTLDQAQLKAVRTGRSRVELELGHSMPFFEEFRVAVDKRDAGLISGGSYTWELHDGVNSVRVTPVNMWGRSGIPATLSLEFR